MKKLNSSVDGTQWDLRLVVVSEKGEPLARDGEDLKVAAVKDTFKSNASKER